jgi:hypothetical protein
MAREPVYWDTVAFLALLNKDKNSQQCSSCEDV